MKQEMWTGGLYAVGCRCRSGIRSPEYLPACGPLDSPTRHRQRPSAGHGRHHGIQFPVGEAAAGPQILAWILVLGAVGGADLGGGRDFGRLWLPEYSGLTQRVTYLGFYFWMLVIVREIERQRWVAGKAGTPNSEEDEMNLENVGETSTLLEKARNEI